MRLFLIVLIVVGIAFLGIVGLVGNSEKPPADTANYKPGSLTAFFGNLALLYPGATWTVPSPNPFPVPRHATVPASDGTRVARFALKSGNFAVVTFDCNGSDCSQNSLPRRARRPDGRVPGQPERHRQHRPRSGRRHDRRYDLAGPDRGRRIAVEHFQEKCAHFSARRMRRIKEHPMPALRCAPRG